MNKKQLIGMTLILLGVSSLAIFIFQLGNYVTFQNVASVARAESVTTLEQLRNDPTQLASLGITAADLETYGPQLSSYIEKNVNAVYQQANATVASMIMDFVLGIVLCGAGIKLAAERT